MKERKQDELNVIDFLNNEGFKATQKTKEAIEKKGFRGPHDDLIFRLKPENDKISTAIIRFMPNKITPEKIANQKVKHYVEVYQHVFRLDSGMLFVETCPSTIGKKCPICQIVNPLFNGNESDKKKYTLMHRKMKTFMNIVVVKNEIEEDTEKKVFLLNPDKKLLNMIFCRFPDNKKLLGTKNEASGEIYIDPFSPKYGTFFRLKAFNDKYIGTDGKEVRYVNFSTSTFFDEIKPIDDDTFNKYYEKCHDLDSILEWDEYRVKEYDELKRIFEDSTSGTSGKGFDFPDNIKPKGSIEDEVNTIVENDKIDEKVVEQEIKDAAEKDGLDIDGLTESDIEIVEEENKGVLNDDDLDEFLK